MLTARAVATDPDVVPTVEPPAPAGSGARWRTGAAAGSLLGVALALVLVRPVMGGRPPGGEDVMAHLVRADFAVPHLIAHLRPDGWFPRLVLGQQEFLFNGPGLTWLVALVRAATLGTLSTTGALKLVAVAGVAALPPAVAFLARSYGLSRPAAGLAGVLSLLVSSPYGPGLQGLFRVGLVPNQVGAVLFCLALGAVVRSLDGPAPRWPRRAALATAGLLVTHLVSALILAVFVALTVAARAAAGRLRMAAMGRLALAAAGAAGLAAFWLVPILAHRDLHGIYTGWDTPSLPARLVQLADGRILFPAGFGLLVLAGWVHQAALAFTAGTAGGDDRGRAAAAARSLVWVLVPALYLPLAYGALRLLGPGDVALQLPNRGLGYVGLMAVFAVAAPLAALAQRLGPPGRPAALVVAGAAVLAFAPGRGAPAQLAEPKPALRAAAGILRTLVPPGARFATQRDFPAEIARTGVVHPETWLARVSGTNSLNGYNLEAVSTPDAAFAADGLGSDDPPVAADRLARLGVSHVVTTDDGVAGRLAGSGRFTPVWHASPVAILAVEPRDGAPPPASLAASPVPLSAFLTDARAEHVAVQFHADQAAPVTVAVAWSPKWHARLDGHRALITRTADGLIATALPAGDHTLRLAYHPDVWDHLGLALSGASAAAMVWRRRRKRPAPEAEAPGR